jgi:hypothetical protein
VHQLPSSKLIALNWQRFATIWIEITTDVSQWMVMVLPTTETARCRENHGRESVDGYRSAYDPDRRVAAKTTDGSPWLPGIKFLGLEISHFAYPGLHDFTSGEAEF